MTLTSNRYFPIFVDISEMKVLVVGGGKVGSKRALKFREFNSQVTVISLEFTDELMMKEDIEKIKGEANSLNDEFISKFDIIVTATNNREVNSRLCERAKQLRKLCNNPTNPSQSSFIVPIFYESEDLGIAVTTLGKSSIMSKVILDRVLELINRDPKILFEVKVMGEVKNLLKAKVNDPSLRYVLYQKIFVDKQFETYVNDGNVNSAMKRAEEIINESSS
ncbi:bifunctional precorrin-2 dehydrogenase/sirohydrochlorin ferrochelatase [Metallosphaera tengchongensis]|uniref:precorrin-2 dehydrogenase n=1 Tax=Metallosphaera tengchongensis TaxID=1532350 RepID=A0A6N0NX76_9CREN|nr:NAD(P)-dependent oxidoreductase [Metallosphaera tengchongensis]QKQ99967.1 bifunctional precorrin-2 dehydrogenase/sirohydrochlorin ferrochelatase [Metallosphaera tengchongensis]